MYLNVYMIMRLKFVEKKGGKGSGHFRHAGRPGKVGGSAPKVNITGNYKNWDFDLFKQRNVEMVSVDELYKMIEFDRALRPFTSNISELANDIVKNGITDSLILDYSAVNHKVFMIEGNHRIAALRQLGISHAPARVVTSKRSPNEKGILVSGIKPDWSGYVPSASTPTQIGLDAIPIDEFLKLITQL